MRISLVKPIGFFVLVLLSFSVVAIAGMAGGCDGRGDVGSGASGGASAAGGAKWFAADDPRIQYMGRIDVSNPRLPRFWDPGTVVRFRFSGPGCRIVVHDEVKYGNTHNYVVVIGGRDSFRVKLKGNTDTLTIRGGGDNVVTVCKATEGIGWMEMVGVEAENLLPAPPLPDRKIECIGNSITCGLGNDVQDIPCGKGEWYDQHNAWMSYGAVTARALKSQWHLTAVSGIGLIHSCCQMTITMPEVFDRTDSRGDQGVWKFSDYQPDVVTVCLGQNDGIQDSTTFCGAYVRFVGHLRAVYPAARIVLLTSPMGDAKLTAVLERYIGGVVRASGDGRVSSFFFSKQWTHGCGSHPDIADDIEIAGELTTYVKGLMNW
jgi:hypothetical protein